MRRTAILTAALVSAVMLCSCTRSVLHVSERGNDDGSGSPLRPFASLGAAVDKASELHARHDNTIKIKIAAGTYYQSSPVEFGPGDGNLIIEGKGRGRTVISGAVALPEFKCDGQGGLWSADLSGTLPSGGSVEQLFVNGERAVRARTPNGLDMFLSGPVTEIPVDPVPERSASRSGAYSQTMKIPADAVETLSGTVKKAPGQLKVDFLHAWDLTLRPVLSFSPEDSTITVAGSGMKSWNRMDNCSQFYLEDDISFLDEGGEFFYDEDSSRLYYMPREGENVEESYAVIPSARNLIVISGDRDTHVTDICFSGISFEYTRYTTPWIGEDPQQAASSKDAAVMLDYADRISFNDCEIAHTGNNGIWIRTACRDCAVEHCNIHDLGIGAVKIGAIAKPDDEDLLLTKRITVDNNILRAGSRTIETGVGVTLFQASDCSITHNDVSDFYYSGMSIGWNWGYAHSPSKRNKILFNHIHHIGWGVLSDMGGVYTLGPSEGTEVSDNVIHDIYSYGYGGWGLYTDEGSTGIRMERNLVYNCKSSGFHQHYGKENVISNNIFVNGIVAQLEATRVEEHLSFTFSNNVIYYAGGKMYGINWDKAHSDVNSNLYWHEGGEVSFNGLSLEEWRESAGKDQNSVIADPEFGDIAGKDFHIADNDALEAIGFKTFDYSQAGVYGDEAWKALAAPDKSRESLYDAAVKRYLGY